MGCYSRNDNVSYSKTDAVTQTCGLNYNLQSRREKLPVRTSGENLERETGLIGVTPDLWVISPKSVMTSVLSKSFTDSLTET